MQQVVTTFQRLLPDFVEHVSEQIVATHVPVYETLPRMHVQQALFDAIGALGIDLARDTTSTYATYWRNVALQRAQQGVSPVHSMQVTQISSDVMTQLLKQHFYAHPQAVVWWLERMHRIISFGMLAMTEARIDALRAIGALPQIHQQSSQGTFNRLASTNNHFFVVEHVAAPTTLRIQTLGGFRAWLGDTEITTWGRRAAQYLLGLLVAKRGQWLHRDQISDVLWADVDPLTAETRFKVALNALINALEPQRSSRQSSCYIERRGATYRLAIDSPHVVVDCGQFETLLDQAQRTPEQSHKIAMLTSALKLYHGDFLPDCLYADWTNPIREHLLQQFVRAGCELATLLLESDCAEAIRWCETILAHDDCCESAYQILIKAHLHQDQRAPAQRAYERCATALQRELGLEPDSATQALIYR